MLKILDYTNDLFIQHSVWSIKTVTKLEPELKDCYSAMVELFVMMVLVITLLKLFVVKWATLEEEAGETQTNGVPIKIPWISHLIM